MAGSDPDIGEDGVSIGTGNDAAQYSEKGETGTAGNIASRGLLRLEKKNSSRNERDSSGTASGRSLMPPEAVPIEQLVATGVIPSWEPSARSAVSGRFRFRLWFGCQVEVEAGKADQMTASDLR